MYRVWCKFEPDHVYEITGRKGQWRVIDCYPYVLQLSPDVLHDGENLGLSSTKPYRKGCIIRPHKELNRVFEQRRNESAISQVTAV